MSNHKEDKMDNERNNNRQIPPINDAAEISENEDDDNITVTKLLRRLFAVGGFIVAIILGAYSESRFSFVLSVINAVLLFLVLIIEFITWRRDKNHEAYMKRLEDALKEIREKNT